MQQSGEQSAAARACDIEQLGSMRAIPMGQEAPIAALPRMQLAAADAGPAASRAINVIAKIWTMRFMRIFYARYRLVSSRSVLWITRRVEKETVRARVQWSPRPPIRGPCGTRRGSRGPIPRTGSNRSGVSNGGYRRRERRDRKGRTNAQGRWRRREGACPLCA